MNKHSSKTITMCNRRQFILSSSMAAAGAILSSRSLFASGQTHPSIKNAGLQLWSIAKFLEKDFKGNLDMLAGIGYKELELYGPYPFSSDKDKEVWKQIAAVVGFSQSGYFKHTAAEFRDLLKEKGLSSPCMHIGLDTLRNKLGETAEAAHLVGQQYAGIASIPAEERRNLDGYKRIADEFNVIGEKAKKLGINFYYHNHGYGLQELEGQIPFKVILERTDPSLVYFEMDIFWTTAGGADAAQYLESYPGRFKMLHIKDMKKKVRFSGDGGDPAQWVELFPYITDAGTGVLDLQSIITKGQKSGVKHFIIENDVVTVPADSLRKGYKFLASMK
ncbi:MAG: sugar phosphate isomerase/epimerase [Chitinophagaceae bacterium]|nr:MAG: sugar phosphate isomerase/epimerase [Chitinophagaceae bacterium]